MVVAKRPGTKEEKKEKKEVAKEEKEEKKESKFRGPTPTTDKWIKQGSVAILNPLAINHSDKIVCFDMDDTLIETKYVRQCFLSIVHNHDRSGKTFAESRTDWKWLFDSIPAKLKELHSQNMYDSLLSIARN